MSTLTYKCPSCGAPLEFDGYSQEMACDNCGNQFPTETVKQVDAIEKQTASSPDNSEWTVDAKPYSPEEAARTQAFSCSSCGAELITDETTVATNCAFCGSPSIIPMQFGEETRPTRIIPYLISKEKATGMFHDYFKGKKLVPNLFMKGNTIDEIRKLYVPYWLFDAQANADVTYNASQVSTFTSGKYRVTKTRHFLVRRAGTLDFRDLPVDASSKLDNSITESIEPFAMDASIAFSPETLSGSMANRADVDAEESKRRADNRIHKSTESAFRNTVAGYHAVIPRSVKIQVPDGRCSAVLFPVWLITTKKKDKTYTFAINGQTGELTCNIPYSLPKFLKWLFGLTGAFTLGGYLVATLLVSLGVL